MQRKVSRRSILKSGLIAGAMLPVAGLITRGATAAALPPLDPSDPTAKALGFVIDASKVDTKTYPTFKPGQKCGTCAQFQGKPADTTAPCTIFAGKSVPAGGWCQVWVQKA
ncbi:MAG TPA: high-potential iron-sulfur protein [Steroidobacteraceae bacterium]